MERQTEHIAPQTDRKEMRWGSDGVPPRAEGRGRRPKSDRENKRYRGGKRKRVTELQKIKTADEKRKRGQEGGSTGQKVWEKNQESGGWGRGLGAGPELGHSLQDPRPRPGRGRGSHTRTGSERSKETIFTSTGETVKLRCWRGKRERNSEDR